MNADNVEGTSVRRMKHSTPLLAGKFADGIRGSNRENKPCSRGRDVDNGSRRSWRRKGRDETLREDEEPLDVDLLEAHVQ